MMMSRALLAAAGAMLLIAGRAAADQPNFVGKWHWNQAKSSLAEGEASPKDVVANIQEANVHRIVWVQTIVDGSGHTHVEEFDGIPDGKAIPAKAHSDGTTASFTLIGNELKSKFRSPTGQIDSQTCSLSEDQSNLNCSGSWSDGKGHSSKYVDVYDRL